MVTAEAVLDQAVQFADLLQMLPADQLLLIERRLRETRPVSSEPLRGDSAAVANLEVRNLLRVWAGWKEFVARSVPGSVLQERLGISRQRLGQLRAEGRLLGIAVPGQRELYYPAWQFGPDGAPLPALARVIRSAADAELGPETLDAVMVAPGIGGLSPADRLKVGDEARVLDDVRAAVALGG
jgi:hypothetical protein